MDKLWAPWRFEYVSKKKAKGCVFCRIYKEKKDVKNHVLFRSKHCFALLNAFPYNNGHVMIVSNKHLNDIDNLSDSELIDINKTLVKIKQVLSKILNPGGFNIGLNLGKTAGAGVDQHIHFHLVPRWVGDTNFMPILADTKVISQNLNELFSKCKKEL